MKNIVLILSIALVATLSASAQGEDRVWIFAGNRIDFNTEPPTVTGCAADYKTELNITSVSDRDGNLAYWLNGTELYNSNDEVIFTLPSNGEEGFFYGLSIIPVPGKENVYFFVYPNVKKYEMVMSVIDGTEDLLKPKITDHYRTFGYSGYGKGAPFFVQKYGSRDYWLFYSYYGYFDIYSITEDGISEAGRYKMPTYNGNILHLDGCEMTPDRTKMVASAGFTLVFVDIDNQAGEVKDMRVMSLPIDMYAFSAGGKYLYYSSNDILYRYPTDKLSESDKSDAAEKYSEYICDLGLYSGDIKYNSDGKMYLSEQDGSEYLSIIEDCDSEHPVFIRNGLKLAKNAKDHKSEWYLAFPKTYSYPYGILYDVQCNGEVNFGYNETAGYESLSWDFGDGESSVEPNPVHAYKSSGSYTVRLVINSPNRVPQHVTRIVEVKNTMKKPVLVAE